MADIDSELRSFNNRLQKLNEGLELMKRFGVNEEILEAWLCYNLKIGKKQANEIMDCYEDFYDKMVKGLTIKKLKDDQ